jgi:hypothetical protein
VHSDWGYVHAMDAPRWHLAMALNSAEFSFMAAEVRGGGAAALSACCRCAAGNAVSALPWLPPLPRPGASCAAPQVLRQCWPLSNQC